MHRRYTLGALAVVLLSGTALRASAAEYFDRIASFPITANLPKDADPKTGTVAEIIAASEDGTLLVYTDSPGRAIGLIDITDPTKPEGRGRLGAGGRPP